MCGGGGRNYIAPLINGMIYTAVNLEPKAVPSMHDINMSCFYFILWTVGLQILSIYIARKIQSLYYKAVFPVPNSAST